MPSTPRQLLVSTCKNLTASASSKQPAKVLNSLTMSWSGGEGILRFEILECWRSTDGPGAASRKSFWRRRSASVANKLGLEGAMAVNVPGYR